MKNTRLFLSKNKLNEDFEYSQDFIERTAKQLMDHYRLDSTDYNTVSNFFDDDDWYEFRNTVRDAIEEIDTAFESLRTYPDKRAERDYRSRAINLINIWNIFATIAKENYENWVATGDDYNYIFWRALDTDGWAISNIPRSIISKMVTL